MATAKPAPGERTLLGFDYGAKRIGVAVGQELTGTATPLQILRGADWEEITRLIRSWQPDALVVGLPLDMQGAENEMTRAARRFGDRLHGRYNLPVYLVDERLSSVEAEHIAAASTKASQRTQAIDAIAAQLILQTWLEQQREKRTGND